VAHGDEPRRRHRGGYNSQEKTVGQEGRIFNLIPKEKQREA
jgi:hypothetical protein